MDECRHGLIAAVCALCCRAADAAEAAENLGERTSDAVRAPLALAGAPRP
ncbi:hypothetical protein [Salinibacterium sp. ZJ70]|nr:hypothetical protein [Salinibacterium sp. ZJ70]